MSTNVTQLVRDLIPTSPDLGLFVAPDIPRVRLAGALEDYATAMSPDEVLALFDATYTGNAKDGAVFSAERVIFQNHDWAPVQEIRYDDIVQVSTKRKLLGGQKVLVDVNRGRATVTFEMDFSGKPGAAEYVARFLQEAMMATIVMASDLEDEESTEGTDIEAVETALTRLHEQGKLAKSDLARMLACIK